LFPIRRRASSMVTVQSSDTMSTPDAAMRSSKAPD
jgi:hypothetical protein